MGPVFRRRNKPALALDKDGVLPADVLYEFLLRLPANELCRLRLVCRSWRLLTSDPGFARAHASRHPLLAGVHISCGDDYEIRVVDLFSGDIVMRIAPIAEPRYGMNSQLDLVCVSAMRASSEPSSVMNLATGEVVATFLPKPKARQRDREIVSPFLLGHIPSPGEVKVFYSHLCGEGGGHGSFVQTCCIKTLIGGSGSSRRWRMTSSPPAVLGSHMRDRVVIGGVAYILFSQLFSQTDDHANLGPDDMAVFDMAAEEWRPVPLRGPLSSCLGGDYEWHVHHQHRHEILLAMVDDCLVTVLNSNCYQGCSMDLWFLDDMDVDKGLWTKRFSIWCTTPCKQYASNNNSYPQLLLDDGRIIMWEELIHVLGVYDPRTSKWDDIATLEKYVSMNMYRGNLLCPGLQR